MKGLLLSILATGILVLTGCGEVTPIQPTTYALNVSVSPLGAGSVSPANGEYEEGTEITVIAAPASGHTFDYWDSDSSGSLTTTTVIMDSNKNITAYFTTEASEPEESEEGSEAPLPVTYALIISVSPSGAGSVSPANGEFEEGAEVTITADAASGFAFERWSGDASGSLTTTTVVMDSDKNITAHFINEANEPEDEDEGEETTQLVVTQEDVDAARQAILDYWEARNNYDVELTLSFYEESFRQEREEEVRQQINQMKMVGITVDVEEEAEPVITEEGTIEIRMKLDLPWPMGDEHITYYMMKVNGEWKIYA